MRSLLAPETGLEPASTRVKAWPLYLFAYSGLLLPERPHGTYSGEMEECQGVEPSALRRTGFRDRASPLLVCTPWRKAEQSKPTHAVPSG
jgi:hypothetical protein